MQRQLQLRIEAQGKYLKKIIEEQQRISGGLSASEDNCPESKNNITDHVTSPPPPPAFESPIIEKSVPNNNISVDERSEPLTPDSDCHLENPMGERSMKKQRVSMGGLTHQILESSIRPPFQQQQSVYLTTTEQFGHSSGMSVDVED